MDETCNGGDFSFVEPSQSGSETWSLIIEIPTATETIVHEVPNMEITKNYNNVDFGDANDDILVTVVRY